MGGGLGVNWGAVAHPAIASSSNAVPIANLALMTDPRDA
jgi:hypothetical protein